MATEPIDTSDSQLPDELQFLGEQLWEDAEHLARTYPPNAPRNWRRAFAAAVVQRAEPAPDRLHKTAADANRGRSAVLRGAAAAAVILVMAAGWYASGLPQSAGPADGPSAAGQASQQRQQAGEPIPAGAGLMTSLDVPVWRNQSPQAAQPTVVVPIGADTLDFLSLPEQEALIDAMNKNRIQEPNVPY